MILGNWVVRMPYFSATVEKSVGKEQPNLSNSY